MTVQAAGLWAKLNPKVEAGEKVDQADWLIARFGLGKIDLSKAKEERAKLELTGMKKTMIDGAIFQQELMPVARQRRPDPEQQAEKVYGFYKAGKRLPKGSSLQGFFDMMTAKGAEKAGDAEAGTTLFERHFEAIARFFRNKTDGPLDDLVQRTFLGVLEGRDRIRGEAGFRGYLFGVARNVLRKSWQARAPDRR